MKRRDPDEPELWSGDPAPERGEPAPEIDAGLGESDDPLGRVLIRHPPALFPDPEPPHHAPEAEPAETVSLFDDVAAAGAPAGPETPRAAPSASRLTAFLADASLCGIVAAGSFLGAAAVVRRSPAPAGWLWCLGFAFLVSFFVVVPTLALFGRTPGMALADLTADDSSGEKPELGASLARWGATVLTALLAGLPLATMIFDRRRRTPADLLSGRPIFSSREPVA